MALATTTLGNALIDDARAGSLIVGGPALAAIVATPGTATLVNSGNSTATLTRGADMGFGTGPFGSFGFGGTDPGAIVADVSLTPAAGLSNLQTT